MRCAALAVLVALLSALPATAVAQEPTDDQKTIYTLGIAISQSLAGFALTEAEFEWLKSGLTDGVMKRPLKVDVQQYGPRIQALQQQRTAAVSAAEKKKGQEYLATAAAATGAVKTASGLVISTVTPGTGASPTATDKVKVHYHGTLTDGTVFDSSVRRGTPTEFRLDGVIPCWTEGVQQMKVGGKSRLVCPPELAYGDRGAPPAIKPGATLVFEVELLEIQK